MAKKKKKKKDPSQQAVGINSTILLTSTASGKIVSDPVFTFYLLWDRVSSSSCWSRSSCVAEDARDKYRTLSYQASVLPLKRIPNPHVYFAFACHAFH